MLQWELQYVTVGVTVCYSGSNSMLQWELQHVTVVCGGMECSFQSRF
jgi:hypothetical protein